MTDRLILGSRGSTLALWQAEHIRQALFEQHPHLSIELKIITTKGDRILDSPLAQIGDKGLFVKELEEALLRREIDAAVHSCKDMPSVLAEGLELVACSDREDPRDVLVSHQNRALGSLACGSVIGTSSLRRTCQIRAMRPDVIIKPIRGNLDTRLAKLEQGLFDAIIVAAAGMLRLGRSLAISEFLSEQLMVPAAGQGVIGIETRADDPDLQGLFSCVNNRASQAAVTAERNFLKTLGGGCQVPIATHARCDEELTTVTLTGLVGDVRGEQIIRDSLSGPVASAACIGSELAEQLLDRGAGEILRTFGQQRF